MSLEDLLLLVSENTVNEKKIMEVEGPIFFILGAGASVDSGMKTYRGGGGGVGDDIPYPPEGREERLYTYYDPNDPPMTVDALGNDEKMRRMWNHVEELRRDKDKAIHGYTYIKLQEMLAAVRGNAMVVTQNVDGLASRRRIETSGAPVIELHGHLDSATCTQCGKQWSTPIFAAPMELSTPRGKQHLEDRRARRSSFSEDWNTDKVNKLLEHHCGECGAWLRPDIVLLGESINPRHGFEIFSWIQKNKPKECYVVGTTLQFSYLRHFILKCRHNGARIIHVNTDQEYAWHRLREKTVCVDGQVMTRFVKRKREDELRMKL